MPSSQPDPAVPDPEPPDSLAARLNAKYGEGVDPHISLGDHAQDRSAPTSELLRRLSGHSSKESRYALEGEIARGGMGAILKIWDADLRRHLAMKVILGRDEARTSGETPRIEASQIARFLEEAQVTGQLDHPGIVPVHELGLDHDGRVYFTMKLVKGRDLKAIFDLVFEEKEGWNETRALSMLLRVCEAMSYAHAKGVIHRDLKPANVMVGSFGEVYVMDWGLARVLGRKDAHDVRLAPELASVSVLGTERADERRDTPDSPLVTMDGAVIGTPGYMAPEQARGQVEKLSARTDVYAIGAMLYHLLARRMPYVEPDERVSPFTLLERVLAGPPKPLSKIRVGIPDELVAICEKTMTRDPQARYASTLELAEDLRAFLEHRVVGAYEAGTWAETKKWVQRNKALSSAIGAVLVVALGGAIAFSIKAEQAQASAKLANDQTQLANQRAGQLADAVELAEENARTAESRRQDAEAARADALQQKETAERNAAETKEVADFQSRMLSELWVDEFGHTLVVELEQDLGENLARLGKDAAEIERAKGELRALLGSTNPTNVAQRVLERAVFEPAVLTIEKDYAERPLLASMLETPLSSTLESLGLYELGERAGRAAVAARRAGLGDDDPATLTSIENLALLLAAQGKLSEAEPLFREALAGRRKTRGEEHPDTLTSLANLAAFLRNKGKLTEAEPLYLEALAGSRKLLGDEHPTTLAVINNFALLLKGQGQLSEAEPLYREALAGRRRKLGDEHPQTLDSINNFAVLLKAQGNLSEAEPLSREALAGRRKKLGDEHPDTLGSITNLASLLKAAGKLTEAEPLYREALAGFRKELGDEHPTTLTSVNNFAGLRQAQGELADAETLFREALAGRRKTRGDEHPETLTSINNLADLLRARGKLTEAEPLAREASVGFRKTLGDEHPNTLASINNLALVFKAQNKLTEAEPLFREALASFRKTRGDEHPNTLKLISNLADVLKVQGQSTEAEALYREALAGQRKTLGDEHPSTFVSIGNLALLLQAQGELAEAEALCREALAGRRKKLGNEHPDTLSSVNNLALLFKAQGKLAEAEPLYGEALVGFRRKLGDEHPSTLSSMANLVALLKDQGRLSEAESLCREALAGSRARLGDEHPSTLNRIDKLAGLLQDQGKLTEAEPLYLEALAGRRKQLGDEHPDTQKTLAALVSLYDARNAQDPGHGHDVQAVELRKLFKQ